MARLEGTIALLLREGYKIDCNGQDVGSVADLDRYLQDGKGGELRINFEHKRATIDQETKTVFLNE